MDGNVILFGGLIFICAWLMIDSFMLDNRISKLEKKSKEESE